MSEMPLTGKSRKKRRATAKDDGQNRYRTARQRAGAHRVTQNGAENRHQPRTTGSSRSPSRILGIPRLIETAKKSVAEL